MAACFRKLTLFFIPLLIFSSESLFVRDVYKSGSYYFRGEHRALLMTRPWGGVFYIDKQAGAVSVDESSGRIITGDKECIVKDRSGEFSLSKDDYIIHVEKTFNGIEVKMNDKEYTFIYNLGELKVNLEFDNVIYLEDGGSNNIVVRGKEGEVKYTDDNSGKRMVKSKAGTTIYQQDISGQYSISGTPVDMHPYRFWAVEFLLPDSGLGVFIDLCSFGNLCDFVGQYHWNDVMVVE